MSKLYCAFALAAVFCLAAGYPVSDDAVVGDVARQYRMLLESQMKFDLNSAVDKFEPEKVKFYLYTKQQPDKYDIKHEDFMYYLKNSTLNLSAPTKIFIHDRLFPESFYKELVSAYLRHHPKYVNVITVAYSHYSGAEDQKFIEFYPKIVSTVAKFFETLCQYGVVGEKIHIIGHGVGAHIAGAVARKVSSVKVDRITGLDPVGMEFDENKDLPQLKKDDASFVDVIVTNAHGVGSKDKMRGHVNYYPNGGNTQPRSDMLISHLKSYFYFVESISRGKVFEACLIVDGKKNFESNYCDHAEVINYMGEYTKKEKVGNFYLLTNPVPPYSMSQDPSFKVEEVKPVQTYLNLVFGTKLAPFSFVPKDDPLYKDLVANSETLFKGFGEGKHHSNALVGESKTAYHGEAHHYSNDLKH